MGGVHTDIRPNSGNIDQAGGLICDEMEERHSFHQRPQGARTLNIGVIILFILLKYQGP